MTDELGRIAGASVETFFVIDLLTQVDTQAWIKDLGLEDIPISKFTSDQLISAFLIENGLTKFNIGL